MRAAGERHLGAGERADAERLRRVRELERAVDAVVVGERERLVAELGGAGGELLRLRRAVEERVRRVAVELDVAHDPRDARTESARAAATGERFENDVAQSRSIRQGALMRHVTVLEAFTVKTGAGFRRDAIAARAGRRRSADGVVYGLGRRELEFDRIRRGRQLFGGPWDVRAGGARRRARHGLATRRSAADVAGPATASSCASSTRLVMLASAAAS